MKYPTTAADRKMLWVSITVGICSKQIFILLFSGYVIVPVFKITLIFQKSLLLATSGSEWLKKDLLGSSKMLAVFLFYFLMQGYTHKTVQWRVITMEISNVRCFYLNCVSRSCFRTRIVTACELKPHLPSRACILYYHQDCHQN